MVQLRKNRRSIAALAASLFLAVWASMAIAPCLMAAEAIVGSHCPHCPEPPPPCHDPGEAGVCTYVDGYDFDGRVPAMPKVDIELVALPGLAEIAVTTALEARPVSYFARPPPQPSGPRLHLRYCVLND
jgi:hypothetical protein